jgi:hypothetical protein
MKNNTYFSVILKKLRQFSFIQKLQKIDNFKSVALSYPVISAFLVEKEPEILKNLLWPPS